MTYAIGGINALSPHRSPSRLSLDRLVLLLDTGSTQTVRNTAAAQLGDVVRSQPQQLPTLLARLLPLLRVKSWDTRSAAAMAIEHMARGCPAWTPIPLGQSVASERPDSTSADHEQEHTVTAKEAIDASAEDTEDIEYLSFSTFDVGAVLRHGGVLAGSGGTEYDDEAGAGDDNDDPVERLKRQKRALKQQLGMDFECGGAFSFLPSSSRL